MHCDWAVHRILALCLGDEILVGKSLFAFVLPPQPQPPSPQEYSFYLVSTWLVLIITQTWPTRNLPRFYHYGPFSNSSWTTSSRSLPGSVSPGAASCTLASAPLLSTPNNPAVPWLQASGHTTVQASPLLSASSPSSFYPARSSSSSFPSLHGNNIPLPDQLNCIISVLSPRPHTDHRMDSKLISPLFKIMPFPSMTSPSSLVATDPHFMRQPCSFPDFPTSFPLFTLYSPSVHQSLQRKLCISEIHVKGGARMRTLAPL